MRAVLFGAGATGARIASMLVGSGRFASVEVRDTNSERLSRALRSLESLAPSAAAGRGRAIGEDTDMVVVATPAGTQAALARRALQAGAAVVTTTSEIAETRALLDADQEARHAGLPLVVGAGFMPGLSCLLARLGAAEFDVVDEIHVAKAGTGGPACARQHHRALSSPAVDWRDGRWTRRTGGSGRELCWFPDPVAGRDCYRGALPDALLLVPEFDRVDRVTARVAATRRDRFTAPLPMLRRPHPEGGVGAVRVEIRGWRGRGRRVAVLGALMRPAEAAAIVAASTAVHLLDHRVRPGARGLAGVGGHLALLRAIAVRGLRPVRFEGFAEFA